MIDYKKEMENTIVIIRNSNQLKGFCNILGMPNTTMPEYPVIAYGYYPSGIRLSVLEDEKGLLKEELGNYKIEEFMQWKKKGRKWEDEEFSGGVF